jgi:hypothetical protein
MTKEETFPDPRAQLYPRVKLWPITKRYGLLTESLTHQCYESDKLDDILSRLQDKEINKN